MGRCLEWVSACFWSIHSFRGCTWSLRVFQSSLLQKCQLTGLAQGVKAPLLAFTARTTARTTTRPSGQAPRPVSILKVGFEDANALGHTHQVVQGVQAEAPPWNKHQPRKKRQPQPHQVPNPKEHKPTGVSLSPSKVHTFGRNSSSSSSSSSSSR